MSENGNNGRQSAKDETPLKGLDRFCQSALLSEEGLRELFEGHGLTSNDENTIINSNYQFFRSACYNKRVDEGIIRLLLEYYPGAASATNRKGRMPLHVACYNKSMTRGIIQLLIDAAPNSVRSVDNKGAMPLHILCGDGSMNEKAAVEIAELLIKKYPEAVRNGGRLPIHIAAKVKSPEFCRVLIEAYPGSERIVDVNGLLPFHHACTHNYVATVEYLYKLHPDAVNHATTDGYYPTHLAMTRAYQGKNKLTGEVEILQFLLDCDPNVKLQKHKKKSLLQYACRCSSTKRRDPNIKAALNFVKTIYDAHPEAIEEFLNKHYHYTNKRHHKRVQAFFNREDVYVRQAKDLILMKKPNGKGQLPLHRALQNNASLGSIKLLVKANPLALYYPDREGNTALHYACRAAKYQMIAMLLDKFYTVDQERNTALHYACRGGKYETIPMLLKDYNAVSVSKRNAYNKLPIDLLWESDAVEDRESVEYTECVFRLLKAYPETVPNVCTEVQSTLACAMSNLANN